MKHNAKRIVLPGGEVFHSKAEMDRYGVLLIHQRLGEIRNLRRQVKYPLSIDGRPIKIRSPRYKNGRQCNYTPDFVYEEWCDDDIACLAGWGRVVEESKGVFTDAARLRIAVFEAQYDVTVRITGAQKMVKRRKAA